MRTTVVMLCRLLIVTMTFMSSQVAHAGMIGTDQVAAGSAAHAERSRIDSLLSRSEVANQLYALGIDVDTARDRVAAMTDEEARALAGQLDTVPAGANHGFWILAIVLAVGVFLWWRGRLPPPPR